MLLKDKVRLWMLLPPSHEAYTNFVGGRRGEGWLPDLNLSGSIGYEKKEAGQPSERQGIRVLSNLLKTQGSGFRV